MRLHEKLPGTKPPPPNQEPATDEPESAARAAAAMRRLVHLMARAAARHVMANAIPCIAGDA